MSRMVGWKGCKQIRILVYEKLKSAVDGRPGGWPRCTAREVTWEKFLSMIISKPLLGGGGVILCSGWWGTTTPPCVHSNSSRGADRDTSQRIHSQPQCAAPPTSAVKSQNKISRRNQNKISLRLTRGFLPRTLFVFLKDCQERISWKTVMAEVKKWSCSAPRRLKTGC